MGVLVNIFYSTLIFIFIDECITGNISKTNSSLGECKNTLDTMNYGYMKFYHVSESGAQHSNNTFMMRFMVRAGSNAHILLSPTADPSKTDPVYEIVLGAGKNMFSDVRRSKRKESKRSTPTPDLLSSTEFRTFWISLSKDGLLSIGKWGDDIPFLFWKDTDPLFINYFSFCTWDGVYGRWKFICLENNSTGKVDIEEVVRPLTFQEKLRRDMLSEYDAYVRPVIADDHLTTVLLDFESQHLTLDEKRSILSIHGKLSMSWVDEKARWRPSDYGNLTSLNIIHHEIWQPELILYNAANNGKKLLGYEGMTVKSNGAVTWQTTAEIESWCEMDLSRWPNDQQECEIQFGLWSQDKLLELALLQNGTQLSKQRTGSEWEVLDLLSEATWTRSPWTDLEPDSGTEIPFSALTIQLTLQRKNNAYHKILRVPLTAISIICLLSFWMTPLKSGKIALLCLDLVLIAMLYLAIGSALPAPANHIPRIIKMYMMGLMTVSSAIIIAIVVIGLARYTHVAAPSKMIYNCMWTLPSRIMLYLPQTHLWTELEESKETGNETDAGKIQLYWVQLCTAIDFIMFLVYLIVWGIILAIYD